MNCLVGKGGYCKMAKWETKELADYVEKKNIMDEKHHTNAKLASADVVVIAQMQW